MTSEHTIYRITAADCAALDQHLAALQESIGALPRALLRSKQPRCKPRHTFDVNRYLEIFDRVRLREGHVLDYIYTYSGLGGGPAVYTRAEKTRPYRDREALRQDFPDLTQRDLLLRDLEFDPAPAGFFQYCIFDVVVRQFYLYWHALYNDLEFILRPERLQELLKRISPDRPRRRFAWQPLVERRDERTALVTTLTFTAWGGLFRRQALLEWPNHVREVHNQQLLQYDCGVRF
jgi:hypothetical protein